MSLRYSLLASMVLLASCSIGKKSADVPHGHRLATVMGCTSCHGPKLDGHLFEENPAFAIAWSSNLSRLLSHWSDAQVEAVIRTGRRPNGTSLWFMPTFAQRRLTADDMRDLIAWLRTVPATGTDHPAIRRGPQFAEAMAQGFQDSAAEALRLAPRLPIDLGPQLAFGRYLTTIACAECHGPDLKGARDPRPGDPPDLAVAATYTPQAFARLLKTGIAQSGRPAGAMAEEARKRLSALQPEEVAAIRDYLAARAGP